MLKINKEEVERFLQETVFDVKPGQGKVSFPIIERIYRRLQDGHEFGSIQVSKGIIVDGHHRYVCLKLLGYKTEYVSGGGLNTSVRTVFDWKEIQVDAGDYDTFEYKEIYRQRYDKE